MLGCSMWPEGVQQAHGALILCSSMRLLSTRARSADTLSPHTGSRRTRHPANVVAFVQRLYASCTIITTHRSICTPISDKFAWHDDKGACRGAHRPLRFAGEC